jgi:hypothetical protein
VDLVREALRQQDPDASRFGGVLRQTIDQLLDGQHTGRYRWNELHKTEKTHAGTLLQINLQREFEFEDGHSMDYSIAGVDVDCKFSQSYGGWEIPPEAWHGKHICLLVWAVDHESAWGAGLIRADGRYLGPPNRDLKRKLTAQGRSRIVWVWEERMRLPENVLLHLDTTTLAAIFQSHSGAERVRQLFRSVQGRRIGRGVVATVAKQEDFMKRIRGNGGARTTLRPEGIIILGQFGAHLGIARDLGLPLPGPGESVSARIVSVQESAPRPKVRLEEKWWAVAAPDEPVELAPEIPHF